MKRFCLLVCGIWALLGCLPRAAAEPYLAVREGLKCVACHVNPSGGGMRNAYGALYAQTRMPARAGELGEGVWSGTLDRWFGAGADWRGNASYTEVPHQAAQNAFETEELRVYLSAQMVPDRLLLYVDQRFAPGGGGNLEAYARLSTREGRAYLKAGQMYLPYGLRLEDDSAFVRQAPGINFTTPDNGVELGTEHGPWSAQLAVTNGSAGGAETDTGKQFSLRASYVRAWWRLGGSFNLNDAAAGQRRLQNLFAGVRTGPLAWLAELDYLVDESAPEGSRASWAGLLETNWAWRRGHNLKLSLEGLDPDDAVDEDERARYSLVWEYTPIPFLQSRLGLRVYEGIPQNDLQNRRLLFWQLHAFF